MFLTILSEYSLVNRCFQNFQMQAKTITFGITFIHTRYNETNPGISY